MSAIRGKADRTAFDPKRTSAVHFRRSGWEHIVEIKMQLAEEADAGPAGAIGPGTGWASAAVSIRKSYCADTPSVSQSLSRQQQAGLAGIETHRAHRHRSTPMRSSSHR